MQYKDEINDLSLITMAELLARRANHLSPKPKTDMQQRPDKNNKKKKRKMAAKSRKRNRR